MTNRPAWCSFNVICNKYDIDCEPMGISTSEFYVYSDQEQFKVIESAPALYYIEQLEQKLAVASKFIIDIQSLSYPDEWPASEAIEALEKLK